MAKFLYSRVHHKPNNNFALFVIINAIVIVLAVGVFIYNFFIFGPRDRIVKSYLSGLKQSNYSIISDLVAREFDFKDEVEKDIQRYGGIDFAFHGGYYSNPTNGMAVDTTIYGLRNFKPVKTKITLIGVGDAWYLVKGELKDEYKNIIKERENGSTE